MNARNSSRLIKLAENSRQTFKFVVGILILTFTVSITFGNDERGEQNIQLLELLSKIQFPTLNLSTTSLDWSSRRVRGMVFFTSYCGVCQAEMPELNRLHSHLKNCSRFELIGVNLDNDKNNGLKAIKDWKIQFPVLWDESKKLKRFLQVRRVPHFVLIDEEGFISLDSSSIERWRQATKKMIMKLCSSS